MKKIKSMRERSVLSNKMNDEQLCNAVQCALSFGSEVLGVRDHFAAPASAPAG